MPSYQMGTMIKKLRTQKGMSQEALAYPIISREALSRIESGNVVPHTKTIMSLFERLGYDPSELMPFFLTTEEADTKRIEDELASLTTLIQRNKTNIDQAHSNQIIHAIKQLEDNKAYMEKPLNQQFVLKEKAFHAFYLEDDENAMNLALQALHITIPHFDIAKINEYHLTSVDQSMIVTLALVHRYAKRYPLAIDILYQLKANEEKTIVDAYVRAKKMTITLRNLAHVLCMANRAQELLDVSEEGMKICHAGKAYLNYRALAWYKAKALFMLGKTDEYIALAKKVYHAMDLYDEENNMQYVRKDVLADTGVDVTNI